jgi:hypothetical protein
MKTRLLFATILLSLAAIPNVSAAQTNDVSVDSYIESLRADVKADRVAIITAAMQFNDKDAKAFWPVYHKYDADISKINDQRVALIKTYANKFDTMTDADAKSIIDQSLNFEAARTNTKRDYVKEFENAGLSPLTVAKFMQLERRMDLVIDVEIAAALPPLLMAPAAKQ